MLNQLTISKCGCNKEDDSEKKFMFILKNAANDSLFYFGIFLSASFILNYLANISGIDTQGIIGIKEVAVSSLGFINVFYIKSLLRLSKTVKCN